MSTAFQDAALYCQGLPDRYTSSAGLQVHEVDAANTTASFRQFHVDQIAADMKESICRVSDAPFDAQENVNIPTVSYEASSLKHLLQDRIHAAYAHLQFSLPPSCV